MQAGFSMVYIFRGLILSWREGCVRARWLTCSQEAEKTQTPADFVSFCVVPQLGWCCPHANGLLSLPALEMLS